MKHRKNLGSLGGVSYIDCECGIRHFITHRASLEYGKNLTIRRKEE